MLEPKQYERVLKEAPKLLLISRGVLCDKFKVNGSVSRKLLRDLAGKGLITVLPRSSIPTMPQPSTLARKPRSPYLVRLKKRLAERRSDENY